MNEEFWMKVGYVINQNALYVGKYWIKCIGGFATILSITFLFVTWDDIGITSLNNKIEFLIVIIIFLLFWSILWICFIKRKKVIWQSASGKIIVRYADLLEESFKSKKTECLYVIPVNSAFDTIVDEDISLCDKPLISPYSLHGRWLKKMLESGKKIKEIDEEIKICLQKQKKVPCDFLKDKEKGKKEIYDLGTVAMVKGYSKNIFLLLALTDLDENNIAHVSVEKMEEVIRDLIYFYDQHGQGHELVIPLMGTNFSRAGLTHDDSLRIITSMFQLYGDRIHGNVSIVIYKGDKDKVTIDI